MAYSPHTYASGDTYDYTDQNRIEQALSGAAADYRQLGIKPTTTWWAVDPSILTTSTSSVALTSGRMSITRLAVRAGTYTALGVECTTAAVGGTYTISIGLYPDNGTGCFPDTSGAPLASSSNGVYTATGRVSSTFASPVTLPDGIYWTIFLYVASAAPSTVPILGCCSNNTQIYARPNSIAFTTSIRGYVFTGQTALPSGSQLSATGAGVSGAIDIPVVAIRAQ